MRALVLVVLLSACASPAPDMLGATRSSVTLQGIEFVVFRKDDRVEVVRMGYLTRAQRAPVPGLMIRAAEQVTGCRVRPSSVRTGLPGDTGEARMQVDC
jgi:hypothetical protein